MILLDDLRKYGIGTAWYNQRFLFCKWLLRAKKLEVK